MRGTTVSVVLCCMLGGVLRAHVGALDIVSEGRPVATIVLPERSHPVEEAAADELRHHVQRATGAALPIRREDSGPHTEGTRVLIGATRAAAALGLHSDELPPNGYVVRRDGRDLYLVGDDSDGDVFGILHNNMTRVGTLFAVYAVVENQMGVRWLWPGEVGEVIPQAESVSLRPIEGVASPALLHARLRDGSYRLLGAESWSSAAARDRFLKSQSKWLRRHRFARAMVLDSGHAFTRFWEEYGAEHPEWFNLLPDGTRRPDRGWDELVSMCVSNQELIKEVVRRWLAQHQPGDEPYSLVASENDTWGKCVCADCLALDVPDPHIDFPWEERLQRARKAFEAGDSGWARNLGSLSDRYARFYLALQEEAERMWPGAEVTVRGSSYMNWARAPRETQLNERIIIAYVFGLDMGCYQISGAGREDWAGWNAAGARLFLRPNWTYEGHCLPWIYAREMGEALHFAMEHGMAGTDFDCLIGQYGAQAPNYYMIARMASKPSLSTDEILDEFYGGFGVAGDAVRAYFEHWEQVKASISTEEMDAIWEKAAPLRPDNRRFHLIAPFIFTPDVMAEGRRRLQAAADAAAGAPEATARVAFLEKGLRQAELVVAAGRAWREYEKSGNVAPAAEALRELDAHRMRIADDGVLNPACLDDAERGHWQRYLIAKLAQSPGRKMPETWKFMWDPDRIGEARDWQAEGYSADGWEDIGTEAPWEKQAAGQAWRAAHGADYDGVAWYRTTFTLGPGEEGKCLRLLFGAVDEACVLWVNGVRLLDRPFPYKGNRDSWREAFEVDVTDVVHRDRPNTVAVRVEDNAGAGGIWRAVWLTASSPPADGNLLADGGFEHVRWTDADKGWARHTRHGAFDYAIDETVSRSGAMSARLTCTGLGSKGEQERHRTKAWARLYRNHYVKVGRKYRFKVWSRTSTDFAGKVVVYVVDYGPPRSTHEDSSLGTNGRWVELNVPDFVPAGERVQIYLINQDGVGTVWFDDAELVVAE